jgi:DNA (cytosine-5)-methyltransferase 1
MMNGLDLFSGIGGLTMALSPWVVPVAYCENDRFAQGVILSRIFDMSLPDAPIWDDVRTLKGGSLSAEIDILYGGFPCQDISVAGHGIGLEGKRSGLYWELYRLVQETNPSFVFLENVPAIRTRGLEIVVQSLTELGYDCRWTIVSAAEVGAQHERKRWFLLAHAHAKRPFLDQDSLEISNSDSKALWLKPWRRIGKSRKLSQINSQNGDGWFAAWTSQGAFKPRVSRAGNGIPFAVDRDKALGNAVVPVQAREAFKRLIGLKEIEE